MHWPPFFVPCSRSHLDSLARPRFSLADSHGPLVEPPPPSVPAASGEQQDGTCGESCKGERISARRVVSTRYCVRLHRRELRYAANRGWRSGCGRRRRRSGRAPGGRRAIRRGLRQQLLSLTYKKEQEDPHASTNHEKGKVDGQNGCR